LAAHPCTVTGGLPFFGGAGNNYSMHAIATMAERLRASPGQFGLVLANGGFLSKEAAGVYSTEPVERWQPRRDDGGQRAIDNAPAPTLLAETTDAVIDSYTVTWKKGSLRAAMSSPRTKRGGCWRGFARGIARHWRALPNRMRSAGPFTSCMRRGELRRTRKQAW
jgi:hypothetical protein